MGLRFFKRRNLNESEKFDKTIYELQWGCAFSSAEIMAQSCTKTL